jgi:DNA-binding response OmpR family regulator
MNKRPTSMPVTALHNTERNLRSGHAEEPAADPSPERPLHIRLGIRRILLADDDYSIRETLGRVLDSEGYAVIYAKNGREAAARFMEGPPDLVLLDLNMPELDGWEAFKLMCDKHPMIPVVVITARPQQYSTAYDLGVDALMEKPLNLPLLLQSIETLLGETEKERTRRLTDPNFRTAFLDAGHTPMAVGGAR